MQLKFLGVSSALSVGYKKFHSNMLIQSNSRHKLLLDCGGDIRHSLFEQGYLAADIDAVYISHLHADHVGGLEWFAFSKYFIEKKLPDLYISKDQSTRLWDNVLSGGMSTLEDREASLETFFNLKPIDNYSFNWQGQHFQLIKVPHSYNHRQLLPSYGLLIDGPKLKIFISTDTRFAPEQLHRIYTEADLIFHDCETSDHHSHQHAHYQELVMLDPQIKKKMWLYDYTEDKLPDALKDGFKGFVTVGQSFEF